MLEKAHALRLQFSHEQSLWMAKIRQEADDNRRDAAANRVTGGYTRQSRQEYIKDEPEQQIDSKMEISSSNNSSNYGEFIYDLSDDLEQDSEVIDRKENKKRIQPSSFGEDNEVVSKKMKKFSTPLRAATPLPTTGSESNDDIVDTAKMSISSVSAPSQKNTDISTYSPDATDTNVSIISTSSHCEATDTNTSIVSLPPHPAVTGTNVSIISMPSHSEATGTNISIMSVPHSLNHTIQPSSFGEDSEIGTNISIVSVPPQSQEKTDITSHSQGNIGITTHFEARGAIPAIGSNVRSIADSKFPSLIDCTTSRKECKEIGNPILDIKDFLPHNGDVNEITNNCNFNLSDTLNGEDLSPPQGDELHVIDTGTDRIDEREQQGGGSNTLNGEDLSPPQGDELHIDGDLNPPKGVELHVDEGLDPPKGNELQVDEDLNPIKGGGLYVDDTVMDCIDERIREQQGGGELKASNRYLNVWILIRTCR
jgi:hypothetical protein